MPAATALPLIALVPDRLDQLLYHGLPWLVEGFLYAALRQLFDLAFMTFILRSILIFSGMFVVSFQNGVSRRYSA